MLLKHAELDWLKTKVRGKTQNWSPAHCVSEFTSGKPTGTKSICNCNFCT